MSTAEEVESAILSLSPSEREKLLQQIPQLFPEFAGDLEWNRIIHDERPRGALTGLLNQYEAHLSATPDAFPTIAESDFGSGK